MSNDRSDYNRMSSADMAKALRKYGGRVSTAMIEAIAIRLIRNAAILKGQADEVERRGPTLKAVRDVAYTYINDPTDANFLVLANALEDDQQDVMQCVRAKALHSAAHLLASMKGCPPGDCPCARPLALCDGACRTDCWYSYLKAGTQDV